MFVIDEKNCSRIYDKYKNENGEIIEEVYIDKEYHKYKKFEFLIDDNFCDYESES